MREWELENYISEKIRYDIPPHFGHKKHLEGVGVLDFYKDQGWWRILMPDGTDFLLHDHVLEQIEFDRDERMLTFVYIP